MKTHEIHEILKSKKKRERGAQGGQSPHSLLLLDLRISWISWVFISGFHKDFKGFHGFRCFLCKYPQNVANALFAESIQSLGPSQCRKHAVCQKYPKPRPFNLLIKKCRPNWFSTPSPSPFIQSWWSSLAGGVENNNFNVHRVSSHSGVCKINARPQTKNT